MKISASGIPVDYANVYWRCWRLDDSYIWNTSGTPAFESFNNTNYGDYDITATRIGNTEYVDGDVPATLPTYTVIRFELLSYSGSPAQGDETLYTDTFVWDGTNRLWTHRVNVAGIEQSDATDQINAACNAAISDADLATAANLATVDTVVDAIQAVTDNLPNSGALTDIDAGVNNIEAKLPTNYIMGSSVQTNKDDEIDAILVDTGTTLPATLSTIDGKVDTVDGIVDDIVADTNELQSDDVPGLIAALNDPTAAAIADAVWDEDIVATHNTADTAGAILDDLTTPGDFKADVSGLATAAALAVVDGVVDAILVDTGTTLETHLADIKGTGFVKDTHSLPQCLTATGFSTHSAADVWSAASRTLTAFAFSVTVGTNNDKTDYSLADTTSDAVIADAVWNAATATYGTAGTYGEHIESLSTGGDATAANQTTIIGYVNDLETRLTAARAGYLDALNVSGTLAHSDAAATYKATGFSTHSAADVVTSLGTGTSLTALPWNSAWDAEVQSEVEDVVDSVIADSVATDGSRPTMRQALLMICRFLMERSISSTTLTAKKEDGSTTSMTFTLDDDTSPTSITRSG